MPLIQHLKMYATKLCFVVLYYGLPGLAYATSAVQQQAFRSANTGASSFTINQSKFLFAAVASVLLLIWFVWVVINTYRAWGANRTSGGDAGSQLMRALFVLIIVLTIVGY